MKKMIFFYFATLFANSIFALNLEERVDDFILEQKQIKIPDHPFAFNPSIVRWRGSLLMSFRKMEDANSSISSAGDSQIGLIWLTEDMNPDGKAHILKLCKNCRVISYNEDARLVNIDERLYIIYSGNEDDIITEGGFRMFIAEVDFDGINFSIQDLKCLKEFEGESKQRREKNWVPFNYQNQLHFAYSLSPHRILRPLPNLEICETIASNYWTIPWQWGELRGGTPAVFDDNQYIAFFHSSKDMISEHSNGEMSLHYFIGAYTFSSEPPFLITNISPNPVIGKGFYSGPTYKPYWKPVKAVFPCGLLPEHDHFWISYGRDDHEIWVAKIDREKLLHSLIPVL